MTPVTKILTRADKGPRKSEKNLKNANSKETKEKRCREVKRLEREKEQREGIMSEYMDGSDFKYLCAIIRKPQEGKTFICLENIRLNSDSYHLIVTMNTIKSNLQFFERARNKFGNNICVFNSKSKKQDENENYLHAKDVTGVKKHLKNKSKVVILCAHKKRFEQSILDLLEEIDDSKNLRKSVIIHIDEAHAYIPTYREKIIEMNEYSITHRIYMYSATPFSIWGDQQIFRNIYIVDIEKEFNIIKSDKYFGVKDCTYSIVPQNSDIIIPPIIPPDFIQRWGSKSQISKCSNGGFVKWGSPGAFDMGNEVHLLSHIKNTLTSNYGPCIHGDKYSLNFVPGFCRKLTHYAIMEMILDIYPRALVIVINGDGEQLFYKGENYSTFCEILEKRNEPSEQIEECLNHFPGRPTFITGFHCVGMSVTFVNERIGNFDNVIYSHEHYIDRPDIQYQLCRFLFNYISWSEESQKKIKKTKLFISSSILYNNCLEYEKQVDKIDTEMGGSMRSREEVVGEVRVKEKKIPKERMFDALEHYTEIVGIKQFTVDDEEDEEDKLKKVKSVYLKFLNKELKGKALPKKDERGFYECSTTGKKEIFYEPLNFKKTIEGWKNTSNFAIKKGIYKYARVYVVYEEENNKFPYRWFIRMMEIKDCDEVDQFWDSYEEKHK